MINHGTKMLPKRCREVVIDNQLAYRSAGVKATVNWAQFALQNPCTGSVATRPWLECGCKCCWNLKYAEFKLIAATANVVLATNRWEAACGMGLKTLGWGWPSNKIIIVHAQTMSRISAMCTPHSNAHLVQTQHLYMYNYIILFIYLCKLVYRVATSIGNNIPNRLIDL